MIFKIFLLTSLLSLGWFFTVDVRNKCYCSQYSTKICEYDSQCSVNEKVCGPLICEYRSKDFCSGAQTKFKCDYDETTSQCQEKNYQCSDLEEKYCKISDQFSMKCVWTKDDKCEDLDCEKAKSSTCPLKYCAIKNNVCRAPFEPANCNSLDSEYCQGYADGYGKLCMMNNQDQCQTYHLPLNCLQMHDQHLIYCTLIGCYIEDEQCRDPQCSDVVEEAKCKFQYYEYNNSISICKWSNNKCIEASETDIESFSEDECLFNTYFTHAWQDNQCQICIDTEIINEYYLEYIKVDYGYEFEIDEQLDISISSDQKLLIFLIAGIGLLLI